MLKVIDHVDILVDDVAAEIAFFETLGFRITKRNPDHGNSVEMSLPGEGQVILEIHARGEREGGIQHLAFTVDGPETIDQLQEKGLAFITAKKYVQATGRTVSNLKDPAGITWQLTF